MIILGLDLARVTGHAYGLAGDAPTSGSWELRSRTQEVFIEPGELVKNLLTLFEARGKPDLIAVEQFLPPTMQHDQTAIISGIMLAGAVHAFARVSGIDVARVDVRTARSVVCGVTPSDIRDIANADKRRLAIKRWVRDRLVLRGVLPKGCDDLDASDATLVWCWAEAMKAQLPLLAS